MTSACQVAVGVQVGAEAHYASVTSVHTSPEHDENALVFS